MTSEHPATVFKMLWRLRVKSLTLPNTLGVIFMSIAKNQGRKQMSEMKWAKCLGYGQHSLWSDGHEIYWDISEGHIKVILWYMCWCSSWEGIIALGGYWSQPLPKQTIIWREERKCPVLCLALILSRAQISPLSDLSSLRRPCYAPTRPGLQGELQSQHLTIYQLSSSPLQRPCNHSWGQKVPNSLLPPWEKTA